MKKLPDESSIRAGMQDTGRVCGNLEWRYTRRERLLLASEH